MDYKEVGMRSPIDFFNIKLNEKISEYRAKYKPFDEPCARLEFRDKLENAERESERRYGYVKEEEIRVEIGNLDKYGEDDRFEFIEDQLAYKDKVIEGSRTQVIEGHTISYKCKARGHGISVFVPNDEYEKLKKKEK